MYDESIQNLVDKLGKLPGIGPKSAARMAFYLLEVDENYVTELTNAIQCAKDNTKFCIKCGNLTDGEICNICASVKRNQNVICVVEEPKDIMAIEKTSKYNGLYHVLGGVLNPMLGITPDRLRIPELTKRLKEHKIDEVILAISPNTEGEATSAYIANILKQMNINTTKLATGIPMGGDIEFVDRTTLGSALDMRRKLD